MKIINVALDGPSGSGKSSIAKMLSKEYGFYHVDTGALYRTVGLYMDQIGVDPYNEKEVGEHINEVKLEMYFVDGVQHERLNGVDIPDNELRNDRRSMFASAVSKHPCVRQFLLDTQRNFAKENSVIMDGRDIGTVILPNANVKVFITASSEERAKRRYLELKEKNIECDYESVLADMITRDHNDATREVAPTKAADDATILDTSNYTKEEVYAIVKSIIDKELNK